MSKNIRAYIAGIVGRRHGRLALLAGVFLISIFCCCQPTAPVVNTAPTITTQPATHPIILGQSVTFAVVATGNPAPTYQWRKGGVNISGATSASYTIASVAATDSGIYDVVVTNSLGSVTSNAVKRMVTTGCPHSPQPPPIDEFDPWIRIISPNGGEVFHVGQQCTVKVCSRYRPSGGADMRIVIGGKAYTTLQYYPGPMNVNSMQGDSSEFAQHGDSVVIANIFAIPETLCQLSDTAKISGISNECVIVIRAYNPPYYPDTSDCYFSIVK